MHHTAIVGVRHRLADLQEEPQPRRQGKIVLAGIGGDRPSLWQVLHHEIGDVDPIDGSRPGSVDVRDARVPKLGEDLGFLQEACHHFRSQPRCRRPQEGRANDLHGHAPPWLVLNRFVDTPHATRGNQPHHFSATDRGP